MRNSNIREEENDAQTTGTTAGASEDTAKVPTPKTASEEQQEEKGDNAEQGEQAE